MPTEDITVITAGLSATAYVAQKLFGKTLAEMGDDLNCSPKQLERSRTLMMGRYLIFESHATSFGTEQSPTMRFVQSILGDSWHRVAVQMVKTIRP
jgi:hypothetical protein